MRRKTVTVMIIVTVWFLLTQLLRPKYSTDIVEGAFTEEYYEEENKDFDVIFLGDCEVYNSFSPVALWKEYGINSYVRGSADQYVWQSYYLLCDVLRYSTPKVVVYNVLALKNDEGKAEYNRMTLEGMEWSFVKIDAIKASVGEDESFLEYVFPLLKYHSRWNELTFNDIKYMFKKNKVTHNGYMLKTDIMPAENVPGKRPLADYRFKEKSTDYLDMMRELCEEKGIKLILVKAPSLYPYWHEEWDEQVSRYANENSLEYINFLEHNDEIKIDYSTDTYDGGMHLNVYGAEKLSKYFGEILKEKYEIPDRREDKTLAKIWEDKLRFYEEELEKLQ